MNVATQYYEDFEDEGYASELISNDERARLTGILGQLINHSRDICGAIISRHDGNAWAQLLASDMDPHRFAAMSSTLLALSDSILVEAHGGSARSILLDSEEGHILIMHAGINLLLTVFTKRHTRIKSSLARAKHAAKQICALDFEEESR